VITEEKKRVLELFAQGRKFYKLMKFAEARPLFEEALRLDDSDGPAKVYLARCQHYIQEPPPEDWDGVFDMKTK